ncbi:acyl carrier protein [Acinetobacter sp. WCHA45]|uniref:acyl carrier protein n=1 Tax=Acinetobacter sp. WCHA45 TaxID=2004644 RepID=UPI000B3C8D51|nr:acyl carrier protein [Acinetobacter sp. WCHA45]AVZ84743.1 acyl carrier protein [Acinetobacter sp. WCHA45]
MDSKLQKIFAETIGISIDKIADDLKYSSIPEWDSITHMTLIAVIEQEFDIMIDAEDVIDMNSFAKAKEIVAKYMD